MTYSAMHDSIARNGTRSPRLMARSMLFDLYGGFFMDVEGRGEAMPLRVVIRLAGDLGVTDVAVRSAVLRMAQDGWLVATASGRERHYALTQRGHRLMMEGRRRMFTPPDDPWDGRWCVVALSVPEARREVRDRMRSELSWLGFGSPSSALYISPRDYHDEVIRLAEELDARPYLQVYRAETLFPADPDELVARAWSNLDAVNQRYTAFLEKVGAGMAEARVRMEAGTLSDRQAFRLRFDLSRAFRSELYDDPELPRDLLPAEWKGLAARRLFQSSFALLGPQAVRYYESVRAAVGGNHARLPVDPASRTR
jgi:phenylacetic acid degradation operon negative regulatory protein